MASLRRWPLALVPLALSAATPAYADEQDWATASDVAVGGLVLWSVGVPLIDGDEEGALEAGISIAAAQGITQLLKQTVKKTRPDGSDQRSFPSGHTATAFAAASSILERRGADEGTPALLLASLVGGSRVKARKHDWQDVLAGAAIGGASGLIFTHPRQPGMTVSAWGSTTGGGIAFAASF